MTIHRTKSGWIELVGSEWRDGQMPQASAGVARITVHNDVTNSVWKFTGKLRDAAEVIGRLELFRNGDSVAVLTGYHIEVEPMPHGFFKGVKPDEDGEPTEFEPDLEAFPDVVAW